MMKVARPRNPCPTSEDARKGREKVLPSGRAWQVMQLYQGYATVFSSFLGPAHPGEGRESVMTARTYESLAAAAARMGVSVKTVRRRIANGVLPVYRSGRLLRLDPNDVDRMFRRYPSLTLAEPGSTTARRVSRPRE
jgi:excisionase family DNA binding protein